MIEKLTLLNLGPNILTALNSGEVFILKTCQRTIVLGFDQAPTSYLVENNDPFEKYEGSSAYKFLLETICGLKSEVVAEYEIVSQFKQAFIEYTSLKNKSNRIIQLFEKIFKDSKHIRTNALKDIGQLSYAGIARKLIYSKKSNAEVLILGSGSLAEDLIKLLKKKHPLYIYARNDKRVQELAQRHSINVLPWGNAKELVKFKYLANTIGHEEVLFDESFFNSWKESHSDSRLFIDLGSPSVIRTEMDKEDGVVRLQDIFKKSAMLNTEKLKKVNYAYDLIDQLTHKSFEHFYARLSDKKTQDQVNDEKAV
jgi:glutamyl-tRNA reductase